jgi:hypothetical protein
VAFTYVTVTRDYDLADGEEPIGTVVFTPTAAMVNAGVTVVAAPVRAVLDTAGVLTISLAANTDPATDPTGVSYLVEEFIAGATTRRYYVQIPHAAGAVVDLATLPALTTAPTTAQRGLRVAAGVGVAHGPAAKTAVRAGVAAGTGAARDTGVGNQPRPPAAPAAGTGAAPAVTLKTAPRAGVATGTGTARDAGVNTGVATGLLVGYSMPDEPKTVDIENEILGRWTARSNWSEVAGALYLEDTELPEYTATYPNRALDLGIPLIPHDRSFDGSTWNTDLDSVISGTHDADHVAQGSAIAGFGPATVYARIWWEFDLFGELSVGGLLDLNKFKNAWRRAVPNIRAGFAAAARPGQVLKINYSPLPDRDDWETAYPGDAYVDVISPDIYGKVYSDVDPTESQMLAEVQVYLDNLVAFGALHGKPIAISEWANVSPKGSPAVYDVRGCGDCPAYINLMFDWALANNALYLCYYDSTAAGVGADLDTTPNAKAAFIARAQAIQATAVPNVPTVGTATGDYFSAEVTFTPPVGGARVATYTATSTPGSFTGTSVSSPIVVNGLSSGTSYTFTVHATNAAGNSAESAASNSAAVLTPTTYAADTFNRADGAVGNTSTGGFAWTAVGGSSPSWTISSNQLRGVNGGLNVLVVNTGHADGTLQVTRGASNAGDGLAFRVVDASNWWYFVPSSFDGYWHLVKQVGGVFSDLMASDDPWVAGGTMTVILRGSLIICKVGGVEIFRRTDSDLSTATRHGVRNLGDSSPIQLFDNFSHTSATR